MRLCEVEPTAARLASSSTPTEKSSVSLEAFELFYSQLRPFREHARTFGPGLVGNGHDPHVSRLFDDRL